MEQATARETDGSDHGALRGIRVVELATVVAGPGAGRYLADFGAEVIKVEGPGGDPTRRMGWTGEGEADSYFWKLVNRNKQAVVLDLKTEDGKNSLWSLLLDADVLIENMRPGKLEALGFGPEELLRRNPTARVLPFENDVVDVHLNARDTVMTNAAKLATVGGGGTNCSAPLARLVREKADVDLVVFVSDNQSWVDATQNAHQGTATMQEWQKLKVNNPKARLVCIDIQPYATTQAKPRADVLNVGGFSDRVFDVVGTMLPSNGDPDHWVRTIEAVEL